MKTPKVELVSECFIKPQTLPEEWNEPFHLGPSDLAMLSAHYIQKGLLFSKPPQSPANDFTAALVENLKTSLSVALSHFFPLAGRLKTTHRPDPPSIVVYVECRESPGARFIHATLDMTVSDLLSQTDVPPVVNSLFDHHKAVNHDGHAMSLLSVQATELLDGVFFGTSMNHCLGDGTSYWNFLKSWSEIFRSPSSIISRPPIFKRWTEVPVGGFSLPFTRPEEFIDRFEAPELRVRFFRFSVDSVKSLKAKANVESGISGEISSLQALSALMWRCISRARNLPPDRTTNCSLAASDRPRTVPPIPENFFGNAINAVTATAAAGELIGSRGLGFAAAAVHRAVAGYNHVAIGEALEKWLGSPYVYQMGQYFGPETVFVGSSPRFDMYGIEFGMGKAVAVLSGYANKFDGKVASYPGRDGGGRIDLEVCLPPETMTALESDAEFMETAGSLSR